MTKLALVGLLVVLMLTVAPARAQEPTPEPGPNAAMLLPEAGAFGDGWSLFETVNPDLLARYSFEMTPDVFREGAAGIYVGPNGSRIVIVSLLITQNRVAIRQSWEDATNCSTRCVPGPLLTFNAIKRSKRWTRPVGALRQNGLRESNNSPYFLLAEQCALSTRMASSSPLSRETSASSPEWWLRCCHGRRPCHVSASRPHPHSPGVGSPGKTICLSAILSCTGPARSRRTRARASVARRKFRLIRSA